MYWNINCMVYTEGLELTWGEAEISMIGSEVR